LTARDHEVHLAGAALRRARHVCAFFHGPDEAYRVLLPFIREGLDRGERAFHLVGPALRADHAARLVAGGIDAPSLEGNRRLEIRDWAATYQLSKPFDADAMLSLLKEMLDDGRTRGFASTRLVAQMEWACEPPPCGDELLRYEARLNDLLRDYSDPVVCAYDLARFGAATVVDVLRTHPVAVIGGVLQENPFYVPPDELLRELEGRVRPVA
jgi:hypothetical protein